jgi:galactofuranosylgalactofuranosylrhamnosyl-N-acetylglucosaminyl-diphospho-decaprenol beta-1,5/1,6-galactofuranosyltransferase
MFLTMLRRGLVLHHRLYREWPELAEGYRAALADITSRRAWEQTLDSVRRQP